MVVKKTSNFTKESITKLLVCCTGKPSSEFKIKFSGSIEFNLLEQIKQVNIPININLIEQRAIIDLITILYLCHNNKSFLELYNKYPGYVSLISSLEEGRLFLIAFDSMLGIKANVQYYLNKYCNLLNNDIDNQLLILLLRQYDQNFLSSYQVIPSIKKKYLKFIKELYGYKTEYHKYYHTIIAMIHDMDKLHDDKKQDSKNNNRSNDTRKTQNPQSHGINDHNMENDISYSLDKLLVKGSIRTMNNKTSGKSNENMAHNLLKNNIAQQKISPYGIFTKKFDEITVATKMLPANEKKILWDKLRVHLNKNIKSHNLNKIATILQARKSTNYISYQENGILDLKRLPNIITNQNFRNFYKIRSDKLCSDQHISFLLDNSGSMQGQPIINTIKTTFYLCKLLEKFHISTEILGFTTKSWQGGESYKLWLKQGRPGNPGRVNDLRHVIYKSSANGVMQIKKFMSLMLKEGFLKENIDGEALLWAKERLKYHYARKKTIIIISDGNPIDEATLELNDQDILNNHLKSVISDLEKDRNLSLIGCGINFDVSGLYKNFINLANHEELYNKFIDQFCNLLFKK